MLIRKPLTNRMKLTIDLPADTAKTLDRIRSRAKADGFEVDLTGAVTDFLVRRIRAVEKQMDGHQDEGAGGGEG